MSSRSFRVGRSLTGLGLFATKPIKRRAYIATYRGRRMTPAEADRLEARDMQPLIDASAKYGALKSSFPASELLVSE